MPKTKTTVWRIYVIGGKRQQYIGSVQAPNLDAAIKTAITELDVTDPRRQKRLVARPEA